MNNNKIRFYVVLNIIITASITVILNRLVFHTGSAIIMDAGSFSSIVQNIARLFVFNVFPSFIIFCSIVYVILKPLQLAHNKLSQGETITDEEYNCARRSLIRLPIAVFIINITGYLLGAITYVMEQPLFEYYTDSYFIFFYIQWAIGGVVFSFLQISINNIILTKTRELLKVYYIDPEKKEQQFSLKIKNVVVTLSVAVYIITFIFVYSYFYIFHEKIYADSLEAVVTKEKTLDEAKKAYLDYTNAFIEATFTKNEIKQDIEFPRRESRANTNIHRFSWYFTLFTAVLLIFTFSVIYAFTIDITNQFKLVRAKMLDILKGEGDLTKRICIIQFDEVGELIDIINRFMENLRLILYQVDQATENVSTSSSSLSELVEDSFRATERMLASIQEVYENTSNQNNHVSEVGDIISIMIRVLDTISQNVSTQSNFVEQTSSSITEMANNIQSVSQVTNNADNLSRTLVQIANQGGQSVKNSLQAIKEVEVSSNQVSEIVSVISQIAEQTNLLAMNAAIEAAHAGSAGKGFAIVADEVRKLAENSAKSAGEIIFHIKDMTAKIANGVNLAEEAGKAFEHISQDIRQTSTLIAEVSSAMQEQNSGATEILSSIESVVAATHAIKDLALEERENSENIKQVMDKMTSISEKTNNSVEGQADASNKIKLLVEKVNDVSTRNRQVVNELQAVLRKFILEDYAQKQSYQVATPHNRDS